MWNVVITEVRHEQQTFSMSTIKRLDAHGIDVGHVKFLLVVFLYRD
jgi:hypothetical protein